jgi:glycolate oxidase FAD binding subunit
MLAQLQEQVLQAAAHATPLRIRGGGSKDFYGQALEGAVLDTRGHAGVVDYEPTELVLTARCGTPLREIEDLLEGQNQMLAFEPPHFGTQATLGGCVASGLSGPRRQAAGSVRDFVLGAQLLDGRGQLLNFGGRVMKNVAGYDLARALAGSLGVLGVLTEISVKVLPRPAASCTLQFELNEVGALAQLNQWAGSPLPISATAWQAGLLSVRLSGAQAAVSAAALKLGGTVLSDEQAGLWWTSLREQQLEFFDGNESLWRLAMPSVAPAIALPGRQLIEWGGGQRWWKTDADAATVRSAAVTGHATLFRANETMRQQTAVFQPLAAPLARIHQRLKASFDPAGIFNPGRMFADL